jgi:tetratricopeptide (TPR) repeat protein
VLHPLSLAAAMLMTAAPSLAQTADERGLGEVSIRQSIDHVARLYDDGRYVEALASVEAVVEAAERRLGPDHASTLQSLARLALIYRALGRYAEAVPLMLRVVGSQERVFGRAHPGTLTSVAHLAMLFWSQGRYAEAEALYQRALEGQEKALGLEHPDALASMNALVRIHTD